MPYRGHSPIASLDVESGPILGESADTDVSELSFKSLVRQDGITGGVLPVHSYKLVAVRKEMNAATWQDIATPDCHLIVPVQPPKTAVLPKSAGEPASTVPPCSASRAFALGSASISLISR